MGSNDSTTIMRKILKLDRDKSKWNNYLDFSIQSDTIFFLQWWDIQGSSGLTIWNRKDTVCYYTIHAQQL